MAQVNLQLISGDASQPGKIGFRVGQETRWLEPQDARQALRGAATTTRWEAMWEAIVRRLRDDGVNPLSATLPQIRTSIERAPLDI